MRGRGATAEGTQGFSARCFPQIRPARPTRSDGARQAACCYVVLTKSAYCAVMASAPARSIGTAVAGLVRDCAIECPVQLFHQAISAQCRGAESRLRGWAWRIRTVESVRTLPDWICMTTSPEVGASRAAETLRAQGCVIPICSSGQEFSRRSLSRESGPSRASSRIRVGHEIRNALRGVKR